MLYIQFILKSMYRTIQKNKLLVFLMIILVAFSFSVLGFAFEQGKTVEENVADYSDTYGTMTYYFTIDGMSDIQYYEYVDDNNVEIYKKFKNFYNKLISEKSFLFMSIVEQPIEIYGTVIPDIFLDGYEDGEAERSIYDMEGQDWYRTKSLQVSDKFFSHFNIQIEKGSGFEEKDYMYHKGDEIPVVLGSEYDGEFQIGDKIKCDYLFEDVVLKVTGILKEEQFFYDEMEKEFKSCGRYIILPALSSSDSDYFDKIRLLLQIGGVIVSDLGYPEVEEIFYELVKDADVEKYSMYLEDPEMAKRTTDLFQQYSSMTEEVLKQFKVIAGMLLFFVIISLSSVLCGFIREKNREYGIQLLCGARPVQILGDIFLLNIWIIMTGSFFTTVFLLCNHYSGKNIAIILLTGLIISIIVSVNLFLYLLKMNISEIIGGKE